MNLLLVVFLITISQIYTGHANKTDSFLPESKNAFKFEGQSDRQSYGLIKFEDQNEFQKNDNINRFQQENKFKFEGTRNTIDDGQKVKFEGQGIIPQQYGGNAIDDEQKIKFEDNRVTKIPHQKKRRRRKPKTLPNAPLGYARPVYPTPGYPETPIYPGYPVYPGPPGFGSGPIYPGQGPYQPGYPGPLHRPRPSATSAALSAVTEALTSIALYDDAQCVPRLLCEAAGGGSVPGTGLIQSIAGLQPLLTLLAAYNGISSSPLFVFGRAVFLGMTSKANPGTCRYAYPQCPNDPEQLVHYLNNHNGGFFRFFAAPELNQPQGLEQFYNQLSGNYGLYQPQQQSPQQYGLQQNYQPEPLQQHNLQQGYGFQQNYQPQQILQPQNPQQGYGLQPNYQNQLLYGQVPHGQYQNQYPQHSYQNQNSQAGYGLAHQQFNQNYQRPSLYNGYGLYGQSYPYQKNVQPNENDSNRIKKRIQNVRGTVFVNNASPKWSFPENTNIYNNVRLGKVLKFPQIPQSNVNSIASHGFTFPGIQSNREYPIDSIEADNYFEEKLNDFQYNQNNGGAVSETDRLKGSNDNGVRVLYIVRGDGDPNNPEIVRLGPGQTL